MLHGALRLLFAMTLGAGACRSRPTQRLAAGGVALHQVSANPRAPRSPEAQRLHPGDWLLAAPELRAGIAGDLEARTRTPGSVLFVEAHQGEAPAPLRLAEPTVTLAGRALTPRDSVFEAVLWRGRPALRWSATLSTPRGDLAMVRDYALDPGREALHIRTLLRNESTQRLEGVATGISLHWGGEAPFAPGVGAQLKEYRGEAPWVGRAAQGIAAAFASTRPGERLSLHFTEDTHNEESIPSATVVSHPPMRLLPEESHEDNDLIFLLRGDLARVTRAVNQLHGAPQGEARVRVLGGEGDHAEVTVLNASGELTTLAEVSRGLAFLSLRPGQYTAVATAQGHAPSDPERFIVTPESSGSVPVNLVIPQGGHIRVEAHDRRTDRDIPVRVVVRGVWPTRDPVLGPPHSGRGAGMVVIAPNGRAEFPVIPGKYRVTVSHGPEWSLFEQEVNVTETLRADVVAQLTRELDTRGWIASDLHVHANPSFDSAVSLEDRVASLVAEGIGFATPTEHNVVGDYGPGVAVLPDTITETLAWVNAVEVTTDRSAQPWGHFNVYPYVPDPALPHGGPPPFLSVSPHVIFRAARANNPGAFIQVNHPRMQPNIGYFNVTGLNPQTHRAVSPEYDPGYDAIEVFNGFYVGNIAAVEAQLNDWYGLLLSGARYVATGSSDSHNLSLQWAGYPRTYVRMPESRNVVSGDPINTDELMRGLRGGHAVISSGPMVWLSVGESGPGDTVALSGPREIEAVLRVEAASWVAVTQAELWRDGERVVTLPVARPNPGQPTRVSLRAALTMRPGSFLTAVVRGPERGLEAVMPFSRGTPFAVTNPIWFGPHRESPPPAPNGGT
ncbi:MAG: CehA/McbA family metallohydrolase [Myxococcales bacterium]|nr:CehA/McbA family metallohydrolase [Myxococcales bacterium]